MSIKEHMTQLKKLKSFHNGSYGASINFAIDTMNKYQKIERIIEAWHQDIYAKDFECIAEVAEVVEDGNNVRQKD